MFRFGTELIGRGGRETLYYDPDAPIQPQQQRWEFQQLLKIYERLNPGAVLEIGSANGGSLYQFMKHAPPGGLFVTVDIVRDTEQWQEWAERFRHRLCVVVGDSIVPDTVDKVKSMVSSVDFLMVDGNHDYEHVRRDFLNYGPLVRPGGVIVLHDIVNPLPGCEVYKFWPELRQYGYMVQELMASPGQGEYGTGVLYVGEYITDLSL